VPSARHQRKLDAQHLEKMRLYNDEVSSYLSLLESRRESLFTRGGLLVASAAISTAIATSSELSVWTIVAMALGTASAILGVIALWPRPTMTVDMKVIRDHIWPEGLVTSMTSIGDTKFSNIDLLLRQLTRTARLVRTGFALLVAAIVSTICHALTITITIGALNG